MSGDELYLGTEPMRNGLELDPKAVENHFNHLFPFPNLAEQELQTI